jgi:hypothetical protein
MSFWKRLFSSTKARLPKEKTPPIQTERKPVAPTEPYNITGQYETVKALIDEAVDAKKKSVSAARRLSDTVGVSPKGSTPPGIPLKKNPKSS